MIPRELGRVTGETELLFIHFCDTDFFFGGGCGVWRVEGSVNISTPKYLSH